MADEAESSAKSGQSLTWRKLEAREFGIVGVLTSFDAEISPFGDSATVRVNLISGSVSNPLSVVGNLIRLAKDSGATS